MRQIEILAVGNELLLGDVQDTNSRYLCQRLTGRGGQVRRIAVVPDEPAAIVREVRGVLDRGTDLLIITGGLGPTDDDLTLRAVAEALGRPLTEHPGAIAILEERYRLLVEQGFLSNGTITPPRRKMAQLPAGAEPAPNPVGTAPGVVLREGQTVLICLPGVPEEMRGIVEVSLPPLLAEILGRAAYAEWTVVARAGEALLSPLLRQVVARHPAVYVKSHARRLRTGDRLRVRVTLSLSAESPDAVQSGLGSALADLMALLEQAGIAVDEVDRSAGRPEEVCA